MRVSTVCLMVLFALPSCYRDPQSSPTCWGNDSCGWDEQLPLPDAQAPASPVTCKVGALDPLRSLVVRHPSVLQALSNADGRDAPLSFGARIRALAASQGAAQALTHEWLAQFGTALSIPSSSTDTYAARVSVAPRPDVNAFTCPWLQLDPTNACSADCRTCRARKLDLHRAPFVLLAVVNRMDLADDTSPCGHDGGELRLVYTAVAPNGTRALPFTIIFEYKVTLSSGHNRSWYAQQWQDLSIGPESSIAARLQAWLLPVLDQAALARVRTNEEAFGSSQSPMWELRQFEPRDVGSDHAKLVQTLVPHTPALSLDNTHELVALIDDESAHIVAGDNRLPDSWLAGSALLPSATFSWQVVGSDPIVRQAFNRNTCNGCHGAFASSAIGFQHIGPGSIDDVKFVPAQLSSFLHNPAAPDDELRRRKLKLETALCASCPGPLPKSADAGVYADTASGG